METKRITQKLMKEAVPCKNNKVEKCLTKLKKAIKTKIYKCRDYRGIRADTCEIQRITGGYFTPYITIHCKTSYKTITY